MPSTNTTSRGGLKDGPAKKNRPSKPPLFTSDEAAKEHDAKYEQKDGVTEHIENKSGIPHIFELILPLSICIGGAIVATIYHVQWLMIVASVIAGIAVIIYFINSRRRARYRTMSSKETMDEQVASYRRDLMKTLEGYDVDRDMTASEIDALVEEYRHHLEVENASLANVNIFGVIGSLFRRKKDKDDGDSESDGKKTRRKATKREKKKEDKNKELSRGGLSGE